MRKDNLIKYLFILVLFLVTFSNLFVLNTNIQKIILIVFLILYTIICKIILIPKTIHNIHKKYVIFLVTILSIMYVGILYFVGIFAGFYTNGESFGFNSLITKILPYVIVVICSELIRKIFVLNNDIRQTTFVTIGLILAEITMFLGTYTIWNLGEILAFIGNVLFAGISINIFCNYMVKRYGIIPNIIYRIITTIYIYIFGILPDVYIFFQSVLKIVYPYVMYLLIDASFNNNDFKIALKGNKKLNFISFFITLIIMFALVILISCQFRYGAIVVGSSSMSGSIDKGDVVIFEKFTGQELQEGQIIIYDNGVYKIIHRIEKIAIRNNENIYYTKGDNNQNTDEGYRMDEDIIRDCKIKNKIYRISIIITK